MNPKKKYLSWGIVLVFLWWILKTEPDVGDSEPLSPRIKDSLTDRQPKRIENFEATKKSILQKDNMMTSVNVGDSGLISLDKSLTSTSQQPQRKKEGPVLAADHVLFEVKMENWAVTQGDVLLGKLDPQTPIKMGQIKVKPPMLWDRGEVPYVIAEDYPFPELIEDVIAYFHEHTPIRFVRPTGQSDGVVFQLAESHCYSYLGRVGGFQPVFLSPDCRGPQIVHEIMHVLGFVHEQSRSDRDQYLDIHWEHIQPEFLSQFTKVPPALMVATGRGEFDYSSVMLYESEAFSADGESKAMTSRTNKKIQPTREGLSAGDIKKIKDVYSHR